MNLLRGENEFLTKTKDALEKKINQIYETNILISKEGEKEGDKKESKEEEIARAQRLGGGQRWWKGWLDSGSEGSQWGNRFKEGDVQVSRCLRSENGTQDGRGVARDRAECQKPFQVHRQEDSHWPSQDAGLHGSDPGANPLGHDRGQCGRSAHADRR